MKSFANKVVIITGAGEGIGRAMALDFVEKGATVVINDVDQVKLNETRKLANTNISRCICYEADVSKCDEVIAFAKFVEDRFERIDLLINNAGVSIGRMNAVDIPQDINEWIFGINYWGTVNCVNSFLPLLQTHVGCKIVNICSLFSYLSIFKRSAYCASKAALKAYSASLRQELKKDGIEVVSVFPGRVNSNIVENSRGWSCENEKQATLNMQDKFAPLSTTEAAHQILKGISKGKRRILVGKDAKLIFLLIRFLPIIGEDLINMFVMRIENKLKKQNPVTSEKIKVLEPAEVRIPNYNFGLKKSSIPHS